MIDYALQLLPLLAINIILASSLGIINGYCGLFSLGHAGFYAVGAYAGASITLFGFPELMETWPHLLLLLSSLGGMVAAGIVGILVGVPCLRLGGDYLAVATLGFGEIIRIVFLNFAAVGGATGLTGIPQLATTRTQTWFYFGAVAVTLWLFRNLINSSFGRCVIAVREDEIAARSMRVNVRFYKVFSFVIGSAFAGLAGALFAHFQQALHPSNFTFLISVQVLLMIVLGGLGSQFGAVLGATIVTLLPEFLRFSETLAEVQMLIFGLVMVIVMLWRPDGLAGLFRREAGPANKKDAHAVA